MTAKSNGDFQFNRRAMRLVIALGLITALFEIHAAAQVLYGSISGTISDPSGAVVPNATVTITNESTGAARNVTANEQGDYAFRDVLPGPYTVSVEPTGNFAKFTQNGIQVQVNLAIRVDVTLQPGSVTAQVVVNTAPPLLQTETAEVSHEISETQLSQLPLTSSQGRQYQSPLHDHSWRSQRHRTKLHGLQPIPGHVGQFQRPE